MGRQLVENLLELGWTVTTYNRGNVYWDLSFENCHPRLNRVIGDRQDNIQFRRFLVSGYWDAVVDFISFDEYDIEQIISCLPGHTGHYIFISTDSVYNVCPTTEEVQKLISSKDNSGNTCEIDFFLDSVLSGNCDVNSSLPSLPPPPIQPPTRRTEDSSVRPKEDWIRKKYRKKDFPKILMVTISFFVRKYYSSSIRKLNFLTLR
eukprot:TRINITY_DN5179_c0_g1_i17.p1 TRINITY_DN5179_c0_g1~~TRINITY_DN5179_c0_g1_i17.p1  ORF type:complete len:205 (+),score=10.00 TRINITY_DN5179_c0_g1_i17:142-756(+)